jgi:hypothetical protein
MQGDITLSDFLIQNPRVDFNTIGGDISIEGNTFTFSCAVKSYCLLIQIAEAISEMYTRSINMHSISNSCVTSLTQSEWIYEAG